MSSSQKIGQEPKSRRGHLRVAAILETAVEVFSAKGYDAATMSEIAELSGTAVASLYRFFPSKEHVADALLLQYAQHVLEQLNSLKMRAEEMSPSELARAFMAFGSELYVHRQFAVGLAEARGASTETREKFRKALVDGVAEILRGHSSVLKKAKSEAMAVVLLQMLKAVGGNERDPVSLRKSSQQELERLLQLYLATFAG